MDEEIKTEKTSWKKIELIVLVRKKPEGVVLAGCEYYGLRGPGGTILDCNFPACNNTIVS
jgi:hypothetical protein